jgi:putative ABC transport system permease protein
VNLAGLAWRYAWARPLDAALNILLLALGIGTICLVLLFSTQVEERLLRDARGIDLVVGAKGSPMQLILSGVYHLDAPTGNIPLAEARKLTANRMVRQVIPLALGDSFRGFRIVGAPHDYVALYGGTLAAGELWKAPMQAVLGADVARATGMKTGSKLVGAHGIGGSGEGHDEQPFAIVGVLAPTGSVLDRLVLTGIESVWMVHDEHGSAGAGQERPDREVTVALVRYASPLAAATLPRFINDRTSLQAASPALETARLLRIVGVGIEVLRIFGLALVAVAALGVFVALYNAMRERRYDLAVMRSLGASPARLFSVVLLEALMLALVGALLGLLLGHAAAQGVGAWMEANQQPPITGAVFLPAETWLLALAAGAGILAAAVPSWSAYRTEVAAVLAQG